MSFNDRLTKHLAAMGPSVELLEESINPPISQSEIDLVHARLGFQLAEEFLAYFRSANGWKIRWQAIDDSTGMFWVRPLGEIFSEAPPSVFCGVDQGRSPYLGGIDNAALWRGLRLLGSATDLRRDAYNVLAIFADAAHPDPYLLVVSDHGACATDHRPMVARDAFELAAMYLDLGQLVNDAWLEPKGAAGDHAVVRLDLAAIPVEPVVPYDRDDARNDYVMGLIQHLRGKAGLKGAPSAPLPVRRYRLRYVAAQQPGLVEPVRTELARLAGIASPAAGTFRGDGLEIAVRARASESDLDDTLAMMTYTNHTPLVDEVIAVCERHGLTRET